MRGEIVSALAEVLRFYQRVGFELFPFKFNPIVLAPDVAIEKAKKLNALHQEIGDCKRCPLHQGRNNIVFGEGNPDAKLMFIGEGPGEEEDLQGRPFVGRAGEVLTSLIKNLGLKREEVYIANVVKCRPPMNRAPKPEEQKACLVFLRKQIEIIKPQVIVTLGDVATKALLQTRSGITSVRGRVFEYKGIKVVPTFHPAYLLRNPSRKRLTWNDVQKALNLVK